VSFAAGETSKTVRGSEVLCPIIPAKERRNLLD
jgi:hypothetical protein